MEYLDKFIHLFLKRDLKKSVCHSKQLSKVHVIVVVPSLNCDTYKKLSCV